ncbi:helix-turn-helix domain-containing protein [Laceyella putida]|uniref:Helix-turn-helix domain-containing protein n=1 Tax=Laceyella putida TaxID=110101 RepID=A0ABW2RQT1_9BACL
MLICNLDLILAKKKHEGFMIQLGDKKVKPNKSNLAIALGVVKQQVSMWTSQSAYPRIDTLYKMAKILEVSVDELYTLEETEEELEKQREEIAKRLAEEEAEAERRKATYRLAKKMEKEKS